jgi:SNW domain-containing protein 1
MISLFIVFYLFLGKIKAAQPKNVKVSKPLEPTYIRYTPGQQGESYNSGASQRIIRMVEMPVDPMEPPKFKHKKIPRGKFLSAFFVPRNF